MAKTTSASATHSPAFVTTLEARGGADHIFLTPHSGMPWERTPYCELSYGHPTLGASLYLAMEAAPETAPARSPGRNGTSLWIYPEGYCGKICVSTYRPQALSESIYWSVPWTATVHLTPHSARPPPWTSMHSRRVLVSFCAATWQRCCTGRGRLLPKPTLWLRERLVEQCNAAPSHQCSYAPPASAEQTALLYWRSRFCLHPGGDTITRKAILDSLLLGCIPVLFHAGQAAQWRWHWGAWVESATITLNQSAVRAGELNVVQHLASLPPERVYAMRDAIRRHAHRMHYAAVDTSALHGMKAPLPAGSSSVTSSEQGGGGQGAKEKRLDGAMMVEASPVSPDAFEVMLAGAYAASKDAELQALGRTLQRTRKGAHAVARRRQAVASSIQPASDSA